MPRPAHRFYREDVSTPSVCLIGDEAHHALDVLRFGVGAEVELFDGRGGLAEGKIVEIARGRFVVCIARSTQVPRPEPIVRLGFAVPKGKRLDWLLEKATELGAATLEPVVFERSVAGGDELSDAKRQRWFAHCLAATKQCGLNWLPEICPPSPLNDFLAQRGEAICILGHAGPEADPLARIMSQWYGGQPICLLVGPEGGLTDAEFNSAREAGFRAARLGRTTLRVETAAIALLAAIVAGCDS